MKPRDLIVYTGDYGDFFNVNRPEADIVNRVLVRWDEIDLAVSGCKRCKLIVHSSNLHYLELHIESTNQPYEILDWTFYEEESREFVVNEIVAFLKEADMVLEDDGWYYPKKQKRPKKRDFVVVKPIDDQPSAFLYPDDINYVYVDWEDVNDCIDDSEQVRVVCEQDEEHYMVYLQYKKGSQKVTDEWVFYEESVRNRVACEFIDFLEEKGFQPGEDDWYIKQEEH